VHLADDLYLIAHDTDGRSRQPIRATELALAAALLTELALQHRLTVHNGRLILLDRAAPDGELLTAIHDKLTARPQCRFVRIWLPVLAGVAIDAVGERLCRAGRAVPTRRRWRRPTRYVPVDVPVALQPRHRLAVRIIRGEPVAGTDAILAGLVYAAGLADIVLHDAPPSGLRHLADTVRRLPTPFHDLIAALGSAVDSTKRPPHRTSLAIQTARPARIRALPFAR